MGIGAAWIRMAAGPAAARPTDEGPYRLMIGFGAERLVVAFENEGARQRAFDHMGKRHARGVRMACIDGDLDVYEASWAEMVP